MPQTQKIRRVLVDTCDITRQRKQDAYRFRYCLLPFLLRCRWEHPLDNAVCADLFKNAHQLTNADVVFGSHDDSLVRGIVRD